MGSEERPTSSVGTRLRAFREAMKMGQEQLAEAIGGTKRGIQDNELGRALPNSKALTGLCQLGLNVNWLLTGEGPMLLKEMGAAATAEGSAGAVDEETLEYVIGALEERIAAAGTKPSAKRRRPPSRRFTTTSWRATKATPRWSAFCGWSHERFSGAVHSLPDRQALSDRL